MVFELISWIYISLLCVLWGRGFVFLFFRRYQEASVFDFPVLCFIGLWALGLVAFSLSLFIPLTGWVKGILQVPALFYFFSSSNRRSFYKLLVRWLPKGSAADLVLLGASILMILFISSSAIIHPDTLNYHVYSIRLFDRFGIIPGIANLRFDLGFQSLWFAVMSVFDFSPLLPVVDYPLSGCVLCWFILFLVSKMSASKINAAGRTTVGSGSFWCLLLFVFAEVSWTQMRLTAASASPDFIVAICIMAAFYFFAGKPVEEEKDCYFLLALFFASTAIAIKLSAFLILLVPLYVIFYGVVKNRGFLTKTGIPLVLLFLIPLAVRNVVASGYPLYPSAWGDWFPVDWKLGLPDLVRLQHYITAYARYPTSFAGGSGDQGFFSVDWIPLWWAHLYIPDKLILLLICIGMVLDLVFLKKWLSSLRGNKRIAFLISLLGVLSWFVKGPDPRFGTGFLLPLIYFQYLPFVRLENFPGAGFRRAHFSLLKILQAVLVLGYIGYRSLYFFHPGQLAFPDGIRKVASGHPDCTDYTKEMLFSEPASPARLPDSCKTFIYRGNSLKAGFRPSH